MMPKLLISAWLSLWLILIVEIRSWLASIARSPKYLVPMVLSAKNFHIGGHSFFGVLTMIAIDVIITSLLESISVAPS